MGDDGKGMESDITDDELDFILGNGLTDEDAADADAVLSPPPAGHLTKTYRCPVKLTEVERGDRGLSLAKLNDKLAALREAKREEASIFTGQIKDVEKQIAELGLTIKSGSELRDIPVFEELDAKARVVRIKRADTKEEVSRRPAAEADLQPALPLPDSATVVHAD